MMVKICDKCNKPKDDRENIYHLSISPYYNDKVREVDLCHGCIILLVKFMEGK
jgi:hypothetical protein